MRGLYECRAEVFRRSENRIKERRKKRSRMLAVCIPLVFCIAAYSVFILPAMLPASKTENFADNNAVPGKYGSIFACSYTEVVISCADDSDSRRITDAAEVARILSAIQSLCDDPGSAGSVLPGVNPGEIPVVESIYQSMGLTPGLNGFVVTFRTEDGYENVYVLDGNELFNVNEKTRILLTDLQTAALKEALGISE